MSMTQEETFRWLTERSNRLEKAESESAALRQIAKAAAIYVKYFDKWEADEVFDTRHLSELRRLLKQAALEEK